MNPCSHCFEIHCRCGRMYDDWSLERLVEMRNLFTRLVTQKKKPRTVNLDDTMTNMSGVRKRMHNLTARLKKYRE